VSLVEGDLQLRLGRNLRARRLAEGMSQEAFADKLGVHRTYMGGLERGERNVTLRTIERLAARLGTNALDLLNSSGR
jgi:transcriptional regulator with XRE-family HTH domain